MSPMNSIMVRDIVIVESPYRHPDIQQVSENIELARNVCRIAAKRGYNPFASHLFYTQFLDDTDPEERNLGIYLGLGVARLSRRAWVILRDGEEPSAGMLLGIASHRSRGAKLLFFRTADNGKSIRAVEPFDE